MFAGRESDGAEAPRSEPKPVRYLLVTEDAGSLELPEGSVLVGRSEQCEIAIDDPLVSRRHARITVVGSMVTIEDLGSSNGTLVDGERIEGPCSLALGQRIQVGPLEMCLHVRIGGPEAPGSGVRRSNPDETNA
jgi:pSer/pThr/pTyr-binding forkhead associated (FHA) protein